MPVTLLERVNITSMEKGEQWYLIKKEYYLSATTIWNMDNKQ